MQTSRVFSIIPPLVQVNTPYPSTSFITGFLRSRGYSANQDDLGLKLVLKVLSSTGLKRVGKELLHQMSSRPDLKQSDRVSFFLEAKSDYVRTIDSVVSFLQGKDATIAHRLASRTLVPEGPRFQALEQDDLKWAFGRMGVHDQAKHIASLYIDDIVDVISEGIDPNFSLSRYGDKLSASQPTFDPLLQALSESTLISNLINEVCEESIGVEKPSVLLITIPFPGCVLGALRIAQWTKNNLPQTKIAWGGGYVNTELRKLKDARIFEIIDAITLDDGERPIECLLEYWDAKRSREKLLRTFLKSEKVNSVEFCSDSSEHDVPQIQTGLPTLEGLPMHSYLSMVEMLNPMHRFWSDLHWNKLMLAHGCYWHQCSFCDVSLDYIQRYEISPVDLTIKRMEKLKQESGSSGFHFVDEAAPPAVLKDLSKKIIERELNYSWWGNIRFEKTFTRELTDLMSDAGCVAVSGGLEVASDRLLKKMKKGVTVEQVARVTKNFQDSKILVHAYLMYGFPSQTVQETIDSLERVRQLFEAGCLTSAFWHRFSVTAHSPIGLNPEEYSVTITAARDASFSENDLEFEDPVGVDHDRLGVGLRKAVYNYMLGIGIDEDVRSWFDFSVPRTQVDLHFVKKALENSRPVR